MPFFILSLIVIALCVLFITVIRKDKSTKAVNHQTLSKSEQTGRKNSNETKNQSNNNSNFNNKVTLKKRPNPQQLTQSLHSLTSQPFIQLIAVLEAVKQQKEDQL